MLEKLESKAKPTSTNMSTFTPTAACTATLTATKANTFTSTAAASAIGRRTVTITDMATTITMAAIMSITAKALPALTRQA